MTSTFASISSPAQGDRNLRTIEVRGTVRDAVTDKVLPRGSVQIGDKYSTADVDGRFTIAGVSSGRQLLTAFRESYLLAGIRKPPANQSSVYRDQGVSITVPTETPFEIVVYMYPAAAVSGTVIDSTGQPIEGAFVGAYRFVYDANGQRTLSRPPGPSLAGTDDRGEFTLALVPGEYILRVGNELGSRKSVVPTYYPSTMDFLRAETVTVRSGDDIRLRPLAVQNAPLFSFYARLFDETGTELSLPSVALRRKDEPESLATRLVATTLVKLPPASYDVEAGELARSSSTSTGITGARLVRTSVEIRDADLTIPITVPAGTKTTIHVLQQTGEDLKAIPQVQASLTPRDSLLMQPINGTTDAKGSASFASVPAGPYRLRVNGAGDLCLREVRQGDAAVPGEDVTISGTSMMLSAILRDPSTLVRGKAIDATGTAVPDSVVALVPEDQRQSRLYAATTSDQDGNFEFKCALPGAYRLFAWTTLPGAAYRNEDFMAKYPAQGTPVRLENGSDVVVRTTVIDR